LALDRHELWEDVSVESRLRLLQGAAGQRLPGGSPFVTVRPMPAQTAQTAAVRRARRQAAREHRRSAVQRRRRLALLVLVGAVVLAALMLTAFGQSSPKTVPQTLPPPASRLLPTGPPTPMSVALHGTLRIQLPVAENRVTAIGYHSSSDGGLGLTPLGRQGNEGALSRLAHKLFGGGHGRFVYYQLSGGETDVLDVGAPPGTDVYAPVDGTVIGISPFILNGRAYGSRIDIQPAAAPSLVVTLTQLKSDPALTVGTTVTASGTKVGRVIDLSGVEKQALAHYTQDAGNHVSVELHPAAALTP
jgi:murein DD-endopeptidase MepM/ murein hydrolase activator NlpD